MEWLTLTDIAIVALSITYLHLGWQGGIFHSIIGPVAFGVSFIAGVIYLDVTENLIMAMATTLISTIVIFFLIKLLYTLTNREVDQKFKNFSFLGSRLIGGVLNWGWLMVITSLAVLVFLGIPWKNPALMNTQKDIRKSFSFHLLDEYVFNQIPAVHAVSAVFETFGDPVKLKELQNTQEFKIFFDNPTVTQLLYDDVFLQLISEGHYIKVLSDARVIKIVKDDYLMKQIYMISQKIYKENLKEETGPPPYQETKKSSGPGNKF